MQFSSLVPMSYRTPSNFMNIAEAKAELRPPMASSSQVDDRQKLFNKLMGLSQRP
jgi:hypothetical protein